MLRLSLLAVAVVCALAQHATHPPLPTYPPGHPARVAHDAVAQQQNNPLYNPHHAEYFRSQGLAYNPGAPPASQQAAPQQQQYAPQPQQYAPQPQPQQYAPQQHAPQQHAPQAVPGQHQQHPTHPPLPTYPPGHPAHTLHAQQLSAPPAQNNPNYNPHHASYFASIGKPYNPPANQPQQYQAPQQQYQAPQQHYQPPPQQQYQAPQQQYQAPQHNSAPVVSNHLQLSYDIGVGKPNQGK